MQLGVELPRVATAPRDSPEDPEKDDEESESELTSTGGEGVRGAEEAPPSTLLRLLFLWEHAPHGTAGEVSIGVFSGDL